MKKTLRHRLVIVSWLCASALSCGGDRGQPIDQADADLRNPDADLRNPDAASGADAYEGDAPPTGTVCVLIGEPDVGTQCTGIGRAWARLCTTACTDPGACQWLSCDVISPLRPCQVCWNGLSYGTYYADGFLDRDGNADPSGPAPDPGDIVSSACASGVLNSPVSAFISVFTDTCN